MDMRPDPIILAAPEPRGGSGARLPLTAVLALIGVLLLWELWLAPIRTGGSWLALKAVPLMLAVPGLARGRRYTAQWLSLALPFYMAEGIVRAWSEPGRVRLLATVEVVLALAAFAAILMQARRRRAAGAGG